MLQQHHPRPHAGGIVKEKGGFAAVIVGTFVGHAFGLKAHLQVVPPYCLHDGGRIHREAKHFAFFQGHIKIPAKCLHTIKLADGRKAFDILPSEVFGLTLHVERLCSVGHKARHLKRDETEVGSWDIGFHDGLDEEGAHSVYVIVPPGVSIGQPGGIGRAFTHMQNALETGRLLCRKAHIEGLAVHGERLRELNFVPAVLQLLYALHHDTAFIKSLPEPNGDTCITGLHAKTYLRHAPATIAHHRLTGQTDGCTDACLAATHRRSQNLLGNRLGTISQGNDIGSLHKSGKEKEEKKKRESSQ